MLKGIDPRLGAEVLHALRAMGHGDTVVLCDTNFPAASVAAETTWRALLTMENLSLAEAAEAVLSVLPLDTFTEDFAATMEVVGAPEDMPPPRIEVQKVIDAAEGRPRPMLSIERFGFYVAAKQAFAVIQTGERRFYGNVIFRKGVIGPGGLAMASVVILGIFVADTAYRAPRLPKVGETLLGQGFVLGPGGKGSNQAVAAARAAGPQGPQVHFITRTGDDDFARLADTVWAGAGVIPDTTRDPASYTGAAFIFVSTETGDNAIIVAPGAAADLGPRDAEARAGLIGGASVFVTQLEQPLPAARRALELARTGGAVTILNPAPAAALPEGLLALCDWVTPNETEAEALTGIAVADLASAEAAARALIGQGAGAAILTLGARGVLLVDGAGPSLIPALSAGPVRDTTGAGDAFNGAFALALAEGLAPRDAARFGCAAAGLSVTRPGAAASMPTRAEIEALLAGNG